MFHEMVSELFDLSVFHHKQIFTTDIEPWHALRKIKDYIHSQSMGKIEGVVSSHAYLVSSETISIGEGSVVEAGAYIQGPCIIGKNCQIRHGAYLRGNIITGDHCVIGHDSEVKNSIFLDHAHAAHFAYVGESILGNNTNLGAGCKCANLKLDRKGIKVAFHDERIETGLRKLGVLLGDGCQVGCNTVFSPGTIIGKGVRCYPCLHIHGHIPSMSLVRSTARFLVESMTS